MADSLTHSFVLAAVAGLAMGSSSPAVLAQAPLRPPVVRDAARELACSPQAVVLPPAPTMRVIGGREPRQYLFGPAETIVVSGGSAQGVRAGQEYFVRRVVQDRFAMSVSGYVPISVHTAAWVRIAEVERDVATATITGACDGVIEGDYLEPFVRPVLPATVRAGEPDYAAAGVIVLGDERRQIGAAGSMMVLDRGTAHGVQAGQRATIFRMALDGAGPVIRVGEATAVIVGPDTSVLRIDSSRDAVYVGDRVALHK